MEENKKDSIEKTIDLKLTIEELTELGLCVLTRISFVTIKYANALSLPEANACNKLSQDLADLSVKISKAKEDLVLVNDKGGATA